jgi:hypothetical protein
MKYLKSFNEDNNYLKYLKNYDHLNKIDDIKDCFIYLYDEIKQDVSGVRVKKRGGFGQYKALSSQMFHNRECDYEVIVIPELGEYNPNGGYRETKINNNLIDEIENSVYLTSGHLNLKLDAIVIEYARRLNHDEGENGPGVVNRSFEEGGDEPEYIMMYKNRMPYDIKEVYKFLKFLGDKLRYVKIYFSEKG